MVTDYRHAFEAARADLVAALEAGCGAAISVCATEDSSRFSDPKTNEVFYETTQTYGLPVVHGEHGRSGGGCPRGRAGSWLPS